MQREQQRATQLLALMSASPMVASDGRERDALERASQPRLTGEGGSSAA